MDPELEEGHEDPEMDPRALVAETWFLKGNAYLASRSFEEAQNCFRKVIEMQPDMVEAHANLGWVLEQTGGLKEAESCYMRSLELDPDRFEIYLNLGALLVNQKRFAEGETANNCALQIDPASAAAWTNRGILFVCTGREDDAERCFRTAIELDGAYAKAKFNFSYLLLRQGRFEEGWAALESRNWYHRLATQLPCPRWGGEGLMGKQVLIGIEAGHGDMIQFARYALVLKNQGATRVGILCHPALSRLFESLDGIDDVIGLNDSFPQTQWDYWSPPLSLPYHCGTRLETIPASIPYLHAIPEEVDAWGRRLPNDSVLVGLVWKGSTRFENDADRSLTNVRQLMPLFSTAGACFVSLQKGAGEEEAAHLPVEIPLTNLGPSLRDFADTAALVQNLDLVISVDTAVAHLAGALGKPCWLLLPHYKTDWRWLKDRTDSPWYPQSMRLFRQSDSGDWSRVIQNVADELHRFVSMRAR